MKAVEVDAINGRNGNGNGKPSSNNSTKSTTPEPIDILGNGKAQQSINRAKIYPTLRSIAAEYHSTMYEHGYNLAVSSRALEARDEDLEAIKEFAAKAARECKRDDFDINLRRHDQMHNAEHDKHLVDRRFAEEAKKFAYAEMRERAKGAKQAKAHKRSNKTLWIVLGAAAAIGLATTFVITFHDAFFISIPDEMLAWLISGIAALIIGGVISVMILFDTDSDGQRSTTNWIGLGAGFLIAIGFGLARLRDAETQGEYLFSFALMLIELGLVLGLEGVAGGLRSANRRSDADALNQARSEALHEEAVEHYRHCDEEVQALNNTVTDDIGYVEERGERNLRISELEEAMIASGRAGYFAGIGKNVGITIQGGFNND
jgi:hypothetical protein